MATINVEVQVRLDDQGTLTPRDPDTGLYQIVSVDVADPSNGTEVEQAVSQALGGAWFTIVPRQSLRA